MGTLVPSLLSYHTYKKHLNISDFASRKGTHLFRHKVIGIETGKLRGATDAPAHAFVLGKIVSGNNPRVGEPTHRDEEP